MYLEEFKKLNEMKEDLETLRGILVDLDRSRYILAYNDILNMAMKADTYSEFKYGTIVARIERGRYCLSVSTLESCIGYAEILIKKTEEYLQLLIVKEYLSPKKAGNVV